MSSARCMLPSEPPCQRGIVAPSTGEHRWGTTIAAVTKMDFLGLMSMAAGAWNSISQAQALAVRGIRKEIEKPKKPTIADAIIEGLIIGALQAATGGIAGFVAGRVTKAVGDAVA